MSDMSESNDQGSFLTGFTVGLFAGAAGYFLFGTDRGHALRNELTQEWEKAKETLTDQPTQEKAWVSLRSALFHVADWLGEAKPEDVKSSAKKPKSKTAKPKIKFKGV